MKQKRVGINIEKQTYLESLRKNENFQEYFWKSVEAQRGFYNSVLRDVTSSVETIRAAQGALHFIDFLDGILKQSTLILEKHKERETNGSTSRTRPREPEYSQAR